MLCQFLVLAGKRFWFNFSSNRYLLLRIFITTGKKKDLLWRESFITIFFVAAGNFYYDRKKKIQSSFWQVRDHYYDRKKKIQSSFFGSGGKSAVFLLWRENFSTTGRKKRYSRLSGGYAIKLI